MRKKKTTVHWMCAEERWLQENLRYYSFYRDILQHLPRHTIYGIKNKVRELGLRMVQPKACGPFTLAIWWELCRGPVTRLQIQERVGCSMTTVVDTIRLFRKANVIYIETWIKPSKGGWQPVFTLGDEPDRRKPEKNGSTSNLSVVRKLDKYQGNPFAILLETNNAYAKCEEDVCS
jgi:hypothetical protein